MPTVAHGESRFMTQADDVVLTLRRAGCVFAEDEAALLRDAATTDLELQRLVARRVDGIPLEQILGWAEFCGLRIAVEPGVFVPRRRSELLVDLAVDFAVPGSVVVDMCCGSGAVGMAIGEAVVGAEVFAADLDSAAVHCARRNLPPDRVFEGDLFAALPRSLRGGVDILVANAPYVPTHAIGLMPPEARLHEHRIALDGGPDGLDVQRRVVAEAGDWLGERGHLVVETSEQQVLLTAQLFAEHGFASRIVRSVALDATAVVGVLL